MQRRGVRVTVVSTISTQPPMVAAELRRQADVFLDIVELQPKIGRDPAERASATRRNSCSIRQRRSRRAPARPSTKRGGHGRRHVRYCSLLLMA